MQSSVATWNKNLVFWVNTKQKSCCNLSPMSPVFCHWSIACLVFHQRHCLPTWPDQQALEALKLLLESDQTIGWEECGREGKVQRGQYGGGPWRPVQDAATMTAANSSVCQWPGGGPRALGETWGGRCDWRRKGEDGRRQRKVRTPDGGTRGRYGLLSMIRWFSVFPCIAQGVLATIQAAQEG
jgi:hypothetical protein